MTAGREDDLSTRRGSGAAELRETALRRGTKHLGARLIPFAGWLMPVQYTGIIDEHRAVRSAAGLFDLGHMGQVRVTGPDALPYLQLITTNDVSALAPGDAQYSLLAERAGRGHRRHHRLPVAG